MHENYEKLTEKERRFVDIRVGVILREGVRQRICLAGDDRAEAVVDAFSRWIIQSRKIN